MSIDIASDTTQQMHLAAPNQPVPHQRAHDFPTLAGDELVMEVRDASHELLGERRPITVMSVRVANVAAADLFDSTEVFTWIDEVMRLLLAVIGKYEGVVDRFTGDGLIALFGMPVAHENDPERAVRSSLEVCQTLQRLRERMLDRHGIDLQIHIGIHSGVVAVESTEYDGLDYVAIGDTVSLACRLASADIPSTVLVSHVVHQSTKHIFSYRPPSRFDLPFGQFGNVFQLVPGNEQSEQRRGLFGVSLPLVGRATELAALQTALTNVCRTRQVHVALVTGEAGLGKSRLMAELRTRIAHSGVSIYEGACLPHMRSAPLYVLADLLRDVLCLSSVDSVEAQQAALANYLHEHGLSVGDIQPFLSYALGLSHYDSQIDARLRLLDAAMLQRQTHTALRQVVIAAARQVPTVLILEDLHWVDPASRDFLVHLIQTFQTLNDVPILLVLITRESERTTVAQTLVDAAVNYRERFDDIQLQALSETEGMMLIDHLINETGAQTALLKQRIARRAIGNPFYLEEIIRVLIDQGGLVGAPGSWSATEQADDLLLQMPATLQGLILARFAGLPEPLRRVVQKAAVIGRSFPVRLLAKLDEAPAVWLANQLDDLVAQQFLVAEAFSTEPGFAFRHALFQEAVYQTLFVSDRQKLHERVAVAIEELALWPADEQVEILAYHYTECVSRTKAIPLLITAAERSARRYAHETAIHYYRQAVALMDGQPTVDWETLVRARIALGQELKLLGHFADANQVLREALHHIEHGADHPDALLQWHVGGLRELADVCQRDGAADEAIVYLEEGLALLGSDATIRHSILWCTLIDRLAWIRFRQGKLDDAYQLTKAATQGFELPHADDPITLASLYNTLGGVLWQQGNLMEAANQVQHSLGIYTTLGYTWGMANAYTNLGILYFTQNMWPQATQNFEHAYTLQCEIGYIPGQALNLKNIGLLSMAMGDHSRARQSLEESLAISIRIGDEYGALVAHLGLAHLAVVESRYEDAALQVESAAGKSDVAGEDEIIQLRWTQAVILAERGEVTAGLALAEQALSTAQETGLRELEAECYRILGVLRACAGQRTEAECDLLASVALCRETNDAYRHGLALHELGGLYAQQMQIDPNGGEGWRTLARDAHTKAADLFQRLGAAYDLCITQVALKNFE